MKEIKIQWHPGFVAAMNLELAANRNDLIYEKEYNLNTKPLEIDLLVIKKEREVKIENEIGKLFRGHNIFEYKSPEDHLDIDSFYKVIAYACLYKAYGETVDERKAENITVSVVRETKPEGLFHYFKERNFQVSNPYAGVYYILEGVLFPTQIIITRELEGRSHAWLRSLSGKLEKQEMRTLLERIEALTQKLDRELADAVLEVSTRANQQVVAELKGEESMCQALLEIMKPEIDKIAEEAAKEAAKKAAKEAAREASEETARQRERAERAERAAKQAAEQAEQAEKQAKREALGMAEKMLQSKKFSLEEIMSYIPRLSVEELKSLAKSQGEAAWES